MWRYTHLTSVHKQITNRSQIEHNLISQKTKWTLTSFRLSRLCSSPKGTGILSLYIILPSFIKIGQELFEINRIKTDRHTHRHIHADEYKDCPKTKFLGQVMTTEGMAVFFCFFFFPGLDYISFLTRCYTFVIASVLDC